MNYSQCTEPLVKAYQSIKDEISYQYIPAAKFSVIKGFAFTLLMPGVTSFHLMQGGALSLLATTVHHATKPVFQCVSQVVGTNSALRFLAGFSTKIVIPLFLTSLASMTIGWVVQAEFAYLLIKNVAFHLIVSGYLQFSRDRSPFLEVDQTQSLTFVPI